MGAVKRPFLLIAVGLGLTLLGWQASAALQNVVAPSKPAAEPPAPKPPSLTNAAKPAPKPAAPVRAVTPMEQREAIIGILNKRNGLWRDLKMKPGQAVRIGDVVVRLRACEITAPWENDQYTGAFLQLIVHGSDDKWRKVFSGWVYKESPSLNVVENPIYDIWVKDCAMRYPDSGPDTVTVRGGESDAPSATRSSAKKSAPRPAPAPDTADSSNDT
jgi:hypothetical protein